MLAPMSGRAKLSHLLLAGGLYAFFAVFLIWPIVQIVKTGFVRSDGRPTLAYVALIFRDPQMVNGLLNAMLVAVSVTLLTLAFTLPIAMLTVRCDFPFRRLLSGLLLVMLMMFPLRLSFRAGS